MSCVRPCHRAVEVEEELRGVAASRAPRAGPPPGPKRRRDARRARHHQHQHQRHRAQGDVRTETRSHTSWMRERESILNVASVKDDSSFPDWCARFGVFERAFSGSLLGDHRPVKLCGRRRLPFNVAFNRNSIRYQIIADTALKVRLKRPAPRVWSAGC